MKTIKTMMLAVAMIMGTSAFVSAQTVSNVDNNLEVVAQTTDDGYVKVELTDLNEATQATIQGYTEEFEVTEIAYNADLKRTKVTLTAKADQAVKVVLLDEEGKEVEEAA